MLNVARAAGPFNLAAQRKKRFLASGKLGGMTNKTKQARVVLSETQFPVAHQIYLPFKLFFCPDHDSFAQ